MRKVNLHWRFLVQRILRDVTNNSHDCPPGLRILVTPGKLYSLADRIFVCPQLFGHRFVNQSNVHHPSSVLLADRTSFSERDFHRAKVTRRHHIEIHINFLAAGSGMIFDDQAAAVEVVTQGKHAGYSRRLDAGKPRDTFGGLFVKGD